MLRQQGLVETRRGRTGGTFVRRPTAPQVGLLRDRLRATSLGELRDLTDEQSAVSGTAARLAATRASTVSVRRLLTLADQLSAAATPGARIMADGRFHIEVAIASKSPRLTALEVALQERVAELLWLPARPTRPDRSSSPAARPARFGPARPRHGGRRACGDRGRDRGRGRTAGPAARGGARGGQPPPPHRAPASTSTSALTGGNGASRCALRTDDGPLYTPGCRQRSTMKRRSYGAPRFLLLSEGWGGPVGYATDRFAVMSPTTATSPRGACQIPNTSPNDRGHVQNLGKARAVQVPA